MNCFNTQGLEQNLPITQSAPDPDMGLIWLTLYDIMGKHSNVEQFLKYF